uniref:Putative oxidoreductase n=1 Tax=Pithovirus LCPAC401 TaxID=2506595 RepID=A0A481ZBI8_9VIRU|nr:MAG: putative oxidoreductase [Pithovirus LCPAC401]
MSVQCEGTTKENKRCKRKTKTGKYCVTHRKQEVLILQLSNEDNWKKSLPLKEYGFGKRGYSVTEGLYTSEELKRLEKSILDDIQNIVFTNRNIDYQLTDYKSLQVFTDPFYRKEVLENVNSVWKNGNSRQPFLSKSVGMINIHYNKDVFDLIHMNERPYRILSHLYGTEHLVHRVGPERFGMKIKGSVNMSKHIDANLWHKEVNYPERVQALICVQIPDDVQPRNSGTLELLLGFNQIWDFTSALFHPSSGLIPMPDCKDRFQRLPSDFDSKYLPELIKYAEKYRNFLHSSDQKEDEVVLEFFKRLQKNNITVPPRDVEIKWTAIRCKPGALIAWDQRLPHRNLRNTSETPRIAVYYGLYPVTENYYGSEEHLWLRRMFEREEFYYSINAGKYPTKVVNIEEKKHRDGLEIQEFCQTELAKKLTSEISWF